MFAPYTLLELTINVIEAGRMPVLPGRTEFNA